MHVRDLPPATPRSPVAPGDPAGIDAEAWIRLHQQGVWRYLRHLGASPEAAEDLLQETFLVALRRGLVDQGLAATRAFLCRTARHLHLRACRRDRREAKRLRALAEAADRSWQRDSAGDEGAAWMRALEHCCERLAPRSRDALARWYGADRASRDGLAGELGLEPAGLKMLLQRARQQLRECMQRRQESES